MFSTVPVVALRNADIYQEERKVLEDVNFEIDKGEFVFLIGRTGSGKSSLLKTLYADLWLESGSAMVAGYEIHNIRRRDIPFLRRRIGIVFQDFQLFFDRNVDENLRFVLRATGWTDSAKMTSRIHEVLMQVGLTSIINKLPHQLSGGEQQRVVIARALLNEPAIILADEPTGNLDPDVSEQILKTFLTINKAGTAILMATHDYDLLRLHTARTLKCGDGKVLEMK